MFPCTSNGSISISGASKTMHWPVIIRLNGTYLLKLFFSLSCVGELLGATSYCGRRAEVHALKKLSVNLHVRN